MADNVKFVEGTAPARPGEFFVKGTDLFKPGAIMAIFERVKGRAATPKERADYDAYVAMLAAKALGETGGSKPKG